MSGNGAIAKVRVVDHLMDDIAVTTERLEASQAQLDLMVQAYKIDKSDDPLQLQAIEKLQDMIQQDKQRLDGLRQQAASVQAGAGIPELSCAPINAAVKLGS